MNISEFLGNLQEIQQEFGDIEMALEDADTDLVQSLDVVLADSKQLFVETLDHHQYCVIPCTRYGADFL